MVIRTFFDRSNTIILNSWTNTGLNPVAELYYGGTTGETQYTRFLFHFDVSRLQAFYSGGTYPELAKMTHTLRMINTGCLDKKLLGEENCDGKDRATSFDLILFPITQDWVGGTGYDYANCTYIAGSPAYKAIPSNWYSATTLNAWGESGVITGATSGVTIATQNFELGNENLELDITDYVNSLITGATNNGLALAYQREYEQLITDNYQYVGFFTQHTQSIYEPYVETIYSEVITDDRHDFYLDKPNKLYLYTNIGGEPTNLDFLPSVQVLDQDGGIYSAYTSSAVTHVTKGVYSIDIKVPTTSTAVDCVMFNDVWSGVTINGVTRPNIMLDFALKSSDDWYNIGDNNMLPKSVGIVASGIKRGEEIKRGDIRKVILSMKIPYTTNQEQKVDNAQYRIYIKEGKNQLTIVDYQPIQMANNHNYFLVDTASLIPTTYYVDIKVTTNNEVKTLKEQLYFDIVSQSELRNSQ
tara:strand:- start:469 stop:1878 length:1410 start_codon:yes stop_codon:yes gene_type:complete